VRHCGLADLHYLAADARDRRDALAEAAKITAGRAAHHPDPGIAAGELVFFAAIAYRWLRERDSLQVTAISITPGIAYPEGTAPMAATFTLEDDDQVTFSLAGTDAKGAAVALPPGFTAAWTLDDPDASGAVLTDNGDGTATLAAGTPTANITVSVAVTITNSDGSVTTLDGSEAVVVVAGALSGVSIVAGSPSAETAEAPAEPAPAG
jgi:hypothetical protein